MESCLYTGQVGHQRLSPIGNAFHYSLFFLYLDLPSWKLSLRTAGSGRWNGQTGPVFAARIIFALNLCRWTVRCATKLNDSWGGGRGGLSAC